MTLVMLAAAGGQDDLLRLLIGKGARVNGRQRNGATALIHAAEKVGQLCSVPSCSSVLVTGGSCTDSSSLHRFFKCDFLVGVSC